MLETSASRRQANDNREAEPLPTTVMSNIITVDLTTDGGALIVLKVVAKRAHDNDLPKLYTHTARIGR